MKKIISIVILLALIGAGVYFFVDKKRVSTTCEPGFRFVPSTQKCEPVESENLDDKISLDFTKLKIQIPDSNIQVELKKDAETTKYSNTYSDPEVPMMQGFVSLDSKDVSQYSSDFVLVPFVVNSGGTGQFQYVGLFDLNKNIHLSSVFVGDRLGVSSILMSGEKVKVNFKNRLDSESFAATPTIPSQIVLEIKDQKLQELIRLQNADYNDIEIKSVLPLVSKGTLTLKGAVPGTWYFEANMGFKILDSSFNEIGVGGVQALSDWMTTQRVPFELSTSSISYKGKGTVIIESDNTRGDEEGERAVRKLLIPVMFQ